MTRQSLDVVLYTEGLPFAGDTLERQSLGGSETAFIYVARELARLGHKVTAYCRRPEEGVYDGVAYKDFSKVDEVTKRECDLFICSRFPVVFAKHIRAGVKVFWMHDLLAEAYREPLAFLAPKIDIIYNLSDYHCRRTAESLPEVRPKLRKLMNGIDPALVDETLAESKGKRHRIMFTSRPERGLFQALEIYEQLRDKSLEFLACTYAFPVQSKTFKAEEERCRAKIDDLVARGFPVSVGCFTKRELYRRLAESKAVIYPSRFPEIFCISAVEAQACGTVFLTVDDFALRETVGYERVAYGDAAAFAERLREILADEALRRELEAAGREHVRPYTWQSVARVMADDAAERLRMNAASGTAPSRDYERRDYAPPPYSERLAHALSAQVGRHLG